MNFFSLFSKNTKASVSTEFCLVTPVLMILFFGMVEITNMIYAKKQLKTVADMAQNFIGYPKFVSAIPNPPQNLEKVQDFVLVQLTKIIRKYYAGTSKMGFVFNLLDKGAVVPGISSTDPDAVKLFVAYQRRFGDPSLPASPRLSYTMTNLPIDGTYFTTNKISDTDKTYSLLASPIVATSDEQYVVIEGYMEYVPFFRMTAYTGLPSIMNLSFETYPLRIGDRFTRLPDTTGSTPEHLRNF